MKNTSIRILAILLLGSFFVLGNLALAQVPPISFVAPGPNGPELYYIELPCHDPLIQKVGGKFVRSGPPSNEDIKNADAVKAKTGVDPFATDRGDLPQNQTYDYYGPGSTEATPVLGKDAEATNMVSNDVLVGLANAINKYVDGLPDDGVFTLRSNSKEGFWEKCPELKKIFDEIKERKDSGNVIETVAPHESINRAEIASADSDGDGVPDSEEVGSIRTGGEEVVTISGEESPFDIIITEDEELVDFTNGDIDRPLVLSGEKRPNVFAAASLDPTAILDLEVSFSGEILIAPEDVTVFTSPNGDSFLVTLAPGQSPPYLVFTGEISGVKLNGVAQNVNSLVGRYLDAVGLYKDLNRALGFAGFGGDLGFGDLGGSFGGGHSINDSDYDRALQSAQQTVDIYGSSEAAKIGGGGGSGFIQVGGVGGLPGVTIDPSRAQMSIQTNAQGGVVSALQNFSNKYGIQSSPGGGFNSGTGGFGGFTGGRR